MMAQIKRQVTAETSRRPAAALARLMPQVPDATTITVICDPMQYSASAIARAVEDCDAHLLNLNVTADRTVDGRLMVDLRIDHQSPASVIRSLERYGYEIAGATPALSDAETSQMRDRVNELIRYLEI